MLVCFFGSPINAAVGVCHREDQPVTPRAKWNGEDSVRVLPRLCSRGEMKTGPFRLFQAPRWCLETRSVCLND